MLFQNFSRVETFSNSECNINTFTKQASTEKAIKMKLDFNRPLKKNAFALYVILCREKRQLAPRAKNNNDNKRVSFSDARSCEGYIHISAYTYKTDFVSTARYAFIGFSVCAACENRDGHRH